MKNGNISSLIPKLYPSLVETLAEAERQASIKLEHRSDESEMSIETADDVISQGPTLEVKYTGSGNPDSDIASNSVDVSDDVSSGTMDSGDDENVEM